MTAPALTEIRGASYYRARYYDPGIGRFATEDPIRFKGGINFYGYVKNRATMRRDPWGRAAWGGGLAGSLAGSAFWLGVGVEGSLYFVGDSLGNQGILDCTGGGFGAMGGVGRRCWGDAKQHSVPELQVYLRLRLAATANGSVSLSNTTATVTTGAGLGAGGGAGLVGVGGDCTLVWMRQSCPTRSSSKK